MTNQLAANLDQNVHLNKILSHVTRNKDQSYDLKFKDGDQVEADILILSIPCSIYDNIDFDPEVIPSSRLNQIKQIHYGKNSKIITPIKKEISKTTLVMNDHVISFAVEGFKHVTLYYTSDGSEFSRDTIFSTFHDEKPMVEVGFNQFEPSFKTPVLAKDQQYYSYNTPIGYSWPNDPFVKGSYSYIFADNENLYTDLTEIDGESVKTLFVPLNQSLYFAGEHTSILLNASGTMESACESGERVARMILKKN
ncbi:FAD-dependent oxidoreductase [Chlamydiales bacterium]|nr:FAD-dependent oxidoreductase [Chlamydiales bacterium]